MAIKTLRTGSGVGTGDDPVLGKTPQGQWVIETPEVSAPAAHHDVFGHWSTWLGNPYERYGALASAFSVPTARKVQMMKDPILAMCIGFTGSMLLKATRVIECEDEAKRSFFESMFRSWEKELILNANIGVALGSVGMVKKWAFEKPERAKVDDPETWKGKTMPLTVRGFDILSPLTSTPIFDDKGRHFQGISTLDGDLDVFYSLWLTFRKELSFGSYYGAGRLEHCYKDWWMSEFGHDLYLVAMQKEADRVVVVGYPPGLDPETGKSYQQIALEIGNNIRSGATAAMPTNTYVTTDEVDGSEAMSSVRQWTVDFLESSNTFDRFHEIDDHHSQRKMLGYFVPPQIALNVKQSALGGPTTSDVLSELAKDLLMQDAADIDRHLNRYVFPQVSQANFPSDSPEVRVRTTGLSPDNLEQLFDFIKTVAPNSDDTKFFHMREGFERLNFPTKTEEEVAKAEEEAKKKAAEAMKQQQDLMKATGQPGPDAGPEEGKAPQKPPAPDAKKPPEGEEKAAVEAADEASPKPVGAPLAPWPEGEDVEITAEDVAAALVDWEQRAPEEARGLLTALTEGMEFGGPGSGNRGHKGRKGQRGGSAPGEGVRASSPDEVRVARQADIDARIARAMDAIAIKGSGAATRAEQVAKLNPLDRESLGYMENQVANMVAYMREMKVPDPENAAPVLQIKAELARMEKNLGLVSGGDSLVGVAACVDAIVAQAPGSPATVIINTPNAFSFSTIDHDSTLYKDIERGAKFVSDVTRAKIPTDPESPDPANTIFFVRDDDGRANYERNTVRISRMDSVKVAVHEMGHWIEDRNQAIARAAVAFRDRRTSGESEKAMADLTGNKGYGSSEVAKSDKFFHPYCGKVYPVEMRYGGRKGDYEVFHTEIISMGMERLYSNPRAFAEEDPDYFQFVLRAAWGYYDD